MMLIYRYVVQNIYLVKMIVFLILFMIKHIVFLLRKQFALYGIKVIFFQVHGGSYIKDDYLKI